MKFSPDENIIFHIGGLPVNATIVNTWIIMVILAAISYALTRNFRSDGMSSVQNFLETIIELIAGQIQEVTGKDYRKYFSFIATLFLFIAFSNLATIIPFFDSPTASLSTTAALAFCVFLAVPFYGISEDGLQNYLVRYIKPSFFMLPFHIISEVSRTVALAVRLFGNIMSSTMIGAIFLLVIPFFFLVIMQLLGLITGIIQAYIFSILALVFISSAQAAHEGGDHG